MKNIQNALREEHKICVFQNIFVCVLQLCPKVGTERSDNLLNLIDFVRSTLVEGGYIIVYFFNTCSR